MARTSSDVLLFFSSFLTHVKGVMADRPFIPDSWQVNDIIKPLFDKKTATGSRQYRTAYIEMPRKMGKSTLASAIALYLLFADEEQGAEIVSAAADREQASIVFDIARSMVLNSEALSGVAKIYRKEIVVPSTNSRYRSISADAYSKHGMNLHGIIFDEVHAQPNRELWDVLTTATGARRQPLTFAITTAGYDRTSLCWELHCYAKSILEKTISDPTFLPVIYSADETDDWTQEKTWIKANPGYGVSVNKDYFINAVTEAKMIPAKEQTFRRLHLCQWTESFSRWIGLDRWDECRDDDLAESLRGQPCYVGLDLASTTDLAALSLVFPQDDGYSVLLHSFAPHEAQRKRERENKPRIDGWIRDGWITSTPGDVIDYEVIRKRLHHLAETYQIQQIAIDRWNATHLSTLLQGDGLSVVGFGQGFASMAAPTKEFESLVLSKRIHHDGNPVLRWNVGNVCVETDAAGNLKPSKKRSSEKIDGVVATIMALGIAMVRNQTGSVYDTGEVFTL